MSLRNGWYKVKSPRRCKTCGVIYFKLVIFSFDKLWQFRKNLRRIKYAQGVKP